MHICMSRFCRLALWEPALILNGDLDVTFEVSIYSCKLATLILVKSKFDKPFDYYPHSFQVHRSNKL